MIKWRLFLVVFCFISADSLSQDQLPQYPGGIARLEKYKSKKTKKLDFLIPPNRNGNSVSLIYNINSDGTVGKVRVTFGLGEPFDSEAVKIIKEMPQWNGGEIAIEIEDKVNFSRVPQFDMHNSNERFENGLIHFNKGNYQKAAEQFSKAIKYNPYNLDSYYNRAVSHLRMERPTDACADLLYIKAQDANSMRLYLQYCK